MIFGILKLRLHFLFKHLKMATILNPYILRIVKIWVLMAMCSMSPGIVIRIEQKQRHINLSIILSPRMRGWFTTLHVYNTLKMQPEIPHVLGVYICPSVRLDRTINIAGNIRMSSNFTWFLLQNSPGTSFTIVKML